MLASLWILIMACDKDLHTAFILFSPPQNTSLLQVFILWELLTHVYITQLSL